MGTNRSRVIALAAAAGCAAGAGWGAIGAEGHVQEPPTGTLHAGTQTCHDFVRFDERWELCVRADGAVETHRLGVLPASF